MPGGPAACDGIPKEKPECKRGVPRHSKPDERGVSGFSVFLLHIKYTHLDLFTSVRITVWEVETRKFDLANWTGLA